MHRCGLPSLIALRNLVSITGFSDPFSSLSHLAGAVVFATLSVPLVRKGMRAGVGRGRVASLVIFAASAVVLLLMSAGFHLLEPGGAAREVFQRLDHAAIFVLIAGTFTPLHAILFRGVWRWGMLALIWAVAIAGVTFKTMFFTSMPETMGIALYLGMGWFGLGSMVAVARRHGVALILPMILGGLAYTIGAGLELFNPPPLISGVIRAHELFHVAVLIGLALHWKFVWTIADWRPAATAP